MRSHFSSFHSFLSYYLIGVKKNVCTIDKQLTLRLFKENEGHANYMHGLILMMMMMKDEKMQFVGQGAFD